MLLHCALALSLFAAAAAPPPKPLTINDLEFSAQRLSEVKLEEKGEVKVEAVRRRLGALAALTGSARDLLRQAEVPVRLRAHFAVAHSHEAFAQELHQAKAPQAARGEASKAWSEQVAQTVERSLSIARAHLRSCVELAGAAGVAKGEAKDCAAAAERLKVRASAPGDAAAVARSRLSELQACFDARSAERADAPPLEVSAKLAIDSLGRVEDVVLMPRRDEERALYDCVSDGLWIWTFPGVADVELELPIRIK